MIDSGAASAAHEATTPQNSLTGLVTVDMDGLGYREVAEVVEKVSDRLLVTTALGRHAYVDESVALDEPLPAHGDVLYLSEQSPVYLRGVLIRKNKNETHVRTNDRKVASLAQSAVFPCRVKPGDIVADMRDGLEAGRVSIAGSGGVQVQYANGKWALWDTKAHSPKMGIAPSSVSPEASSNLPSPWLNSWAVAASAGLCAWHMLLICGLMFDDCSAFERLLLSGFVWLVFFGSVRLACKFVSASAMKTISDSTWWLCPVITVLIALLFRDGWYKLTGAVWYGMLSSIMLDAVPSAADVSPDSFEVSGKQFWNLPACPDPAPRVGERLLCKLPDDDFLRICRLKSVGDKALRIELFDGANLELLKTRVYPYRLAAGQRILALRPGHSAYFPGVIKDIHAERLCVRFDDFAVAECALHEVWLWTPAEYDDLTQEDWENARKAADLAIHGASEAVGHGKIQKAQFLIGKALQDFPFMPDLYAARAGIYMRAGDSEKAGLVAQKAIGLLGSDANAYQAVGQKHLKEDRVVDAEECFRAAVNLAPYEKQHWLDLAGVLEKSGAAEEAAACRKTAEAFGE